MFTQQRLNNMPLWFTTAEVRLLVTVLRSLVGRHRNVHAAWVKCGRKEKQLMWESLTTTLLLETTL